MKYLSLDDTIALHDKMIGVMGGLKGFDKSRVAYLESALEHIQNDDFYPSFLDKLTHLIFCCVKFHPFLDGNKRSAILIARVFIKINYPQNLPNDFYAKLENVVVDVASDEMNKESLRDFLAQLLGL
ncbi:type II toxin-antitoxin system death-on-curing family toxin [Helicobacter sp. T3_23-1056]